MTRHLRLTDVYQFSEAGRIPEAAISSEIMANVASLNEPNQVEPWLREILHSSDETHHGPTEIADILTAKLNIGGTDKFSAFILKGKALQKVSSRHVAHQFLKLKQLQGLEVAIFLAVGSIQDDAYRDFIGIVNDIGCDYLIIDKKDVARLFIAYHKICSHDGLPFSSGACPKGHTQVSKIELHYKIHERFQSEIIRIGDASHIGAKRLSAYLLTDRHYSQETIREIIKGTVQKVRNDPYVRSELVKAQWGNSPAQVVWIYVGNDMADVSNSNWICRACWIDENLDPKFRPIWDQTEDITDGVMIAWNSDYHSMKQMLDEATGSKSAVIEHVEIFRQRIQALLTRVSQEYHRYIGGETEETSLIELMASLRKKADDIYFQGSDGPIPVPECKDYEQCFQNILANFHNLWLYYTEEEFLRRDPENRQWLFKESMKAIEKEFNKLTYEEEKLHRS